MAEGKKLRNLTGVKPTGTPHIGNYLGAIRPAIALAREYESFLFIADLHALTSQHDPKALEEETYQVAATWLACGVDPSKVVFYKQSDIPEVTTLAWILSCFTPMGFLERGHSVKDAKAKGATDINHGVFYYPVLMAADILLYDADMVPVGKDQKQHLEITQEIARKVNNQYGEGTLVVPKAVIDETVMTIPGLDGRKMSKSYDNGVDIFLKEKKLRKRLMQIKTDSTPQGEPLQWQGSTVSELFALFANEAQIATLEAQYASGRKDPSGGDEAENLFGWGGAKQALFEVINEALREPRAEYERLLDDKAYLRKLLDEGAEKAREVANGVLARVMGRAGFVR